ncbi:hypothetical protein QQZ08_007617 [Neonectria magnoliae]|uniref:Uncharacterized protein n=1 Tax=Neonectria magnoliae TaxID=2732573 RepID=A0ABR1HXA2_9HYPO
MAPKFEQTTRASESVPYYANQIAGKTILVTGISSGRLGDSFVKEVSIGNPAAFILAGRSPSKFQSLVDHLTNAHPNIAVKSLASDLTSLANIHKATEIVNSYSDMPHIDMLLRELAADKPSCHFLFTNLIVDKVLASKTPRVVIISSMGHRHGHIRWADYNFSDGKLHDQWTAYGQSKRLTH